MDIMYIQILNSFSEIREEPGFSLMRLHTNFVLYYFAILYYKIEILCNSIV